MNWLIGGMLWMHLGMHGGHSMSRRPPQSGHTQHRQDDSATVCRDSNREPLSTMRRSMTDFKLERLGMVMEPQPGNLLEPDGALHCRAHPWFDETHELVIARFPSAVNTRPTNSPAA